MRTGFFVALAFVMAGFFAPFGTADAQQRAKPVPLKQLPTELRMFILETLQEQGIKGNGAMTYAATSTKDCPSTCNDSSGGGFCFCEREEDGSCANGTEKTGTSDNPQCKIKNPGKGTGIVSGGGLDQPIKIEG